MESSKGFFSWLSCYFLIVVTNIVMSVENPLPVQTAFFFIWIQTNSFIEGFAPKKCCNRA